MCSEFLSKEVKFTMNGRLVAFKVFHNAPSEIGNKFQTIAYAWAKNTKSFGSLDFCLLLSSTFPGFNFMTERRYNKLKSRVNAK